MKHKPQANRSSPPPQIGRREEEFLRHLESEGEMIDDHGPTIVGKRDRKPLLQDPEKDR